MYFDDWLIHLESLHPQGQAGIVLGLDRVNAVKERLKQEKFCPILTVGGTNGKGSTVAYLQSILQHAGYRVGSYTSPHLLSYRERVKIDGQPADEESFCAAFAKVETARQGEFLTYFEFGTLAAFEVFAAAKVDVMVLEVGLGGRLDAVNLYDTDVALITNIALDHCDYLGDTREAIAYEKAGIFRSGKPAFCADPDPPAALKSHAEKIGATFFSMGKNFGYTVPVGETARSLEWQWWCLHGKDLRRRNLAFPGLRGRAQLQNASLALAALECLNHPLPVTMAAIREGLLKTVLPGRFQILPGQPTIVLDVAHNPAALAVLANNLDDMGFYPKTIAVFGMLADKDISGCLDFLRGKIDEWHLASLPSPRTATAAALSAILEKKAVGGQIFQHQDVATAFSAARNRAKESDRIAVFGSFYTVAGALALLNAPPLS